MIITELNQPLDIDKNIKLKELYLKFDALLTELRKRILPESIVTSINNHIEELNSNSEIGVLIKMFKQKQAKIIKLLEQKLKLVPKNYYRNIWMATGMAAFGLPLGVVFGISTGNMGLIGIGLPLGLVFGMALGAGMDKKAFEEGRQLDLDYN
jgi:hypothetical protein